MFKSAFFSLLACVSLAGASPLKLAPADTVRFTARFMGGLFTQEIAGTRIDPRLGLSIEHPVFYSFLIPRVGAYVGLGGLLAGENTEAWGYYDDSLITDSDESITHDTLLVTEYVVHRMRYRRGVSAGVLAGLDFQLRVFRFGGGVNIAVRTYTDIEKESVRRKIIDHSVEDEYQSQYGCAGNINYLLYWKLGVTIQRLSLMSYLEYGFFEQAFGIVASWRIGSFGRKRGLTAALR